DQPIGCDPPRMNIFPELLNIHATLIADFPKSGSASFQGMDSYCPQAPPPQNAAHPLSVFG
ncbi:MAG: hypothetical protein WCB27_14330, partial [Thermoguttaceae bacterium]